MWYKQKTTWAAIAAFVTFAGGLLTGEMTWPVALQGMFGALIAIFLRQGVAKGK